MDVRDRSDLDPDRLDELVLVRLATSTKPPAAVEVVRALRAFAPRTQDDARWAAAIDDALAEVRKTIGDATRLKVLNGAA